MYKKLIGSLMYLVDANLYMCFTMNTLNQFMVESRKNNWIVTRHMLRYLKDIMEYNLRYHENGEVKLQGY